MRGQLIGINTAIFSTSGGYQGIGFAIPSNMVRTIMESLAKEGKVIRGWLGISIQRITPDLAKQFNLTDENGVLVSDVTENGPAEKAGLKRGDVIVEYDGKKTDEPGLFRNMVANTAPGEKHSLKILRDKDLLTLKVTIGELPPDIQQAENGTYVNALREVGVQDITADIAKRLGLPPRVKGVIVNDVGEDSPAYGVLTQGDVVQEIDKKKIANVKDYQQIVSMIGRDNNILLLVYRRGSSLFITLSTQK